MLVLGPFWIDGRHTGLEVQELRSVKRALCAENRDGNERNESVRSGSHTMWNGLWYARGVTQEGSSVGQRGAAWGVDSGRAWKMYIFGLGSGRGWSAAMDCEADAGMRRPCVGRDRRKARMLNSERADIVRT